jgi:hypothetical protein
VNYVVEEFAHGFTRHVGSTSVGQLAFRAARENAARRMIETRVISEDMRSCYRVLPGGRVIEPLDLSTKPVDNDLWAALEKDPEMDA